MKITLLIVAVAAFSTVPPQRNTLRFEEGYVRVDEFNAERLVKVGMLPNGISPYLLTVYVWDNRVGQYVVRQVYGENGVEVFMGSPTYPIVVPRVGEDGGVGIP